MPPVDAGATGRRTAPWRPCPGPTGGSELAGDAGPTRPAPTATGGRLSVRTEALVVPAVPPCAWYARFGDRGAIRAARYQSTCLCGQIEEATGLLWGAR